MPFTPLHTALESIPLSSAGVTLLLRYYGPIRHPASPVHSSRITSWCVLTPLTGLPVLPLLSSSMRATANTPTEVVSVLLPLTSQYANGLPLNLERVGFHVALFEACSTFYVLFSVMRCRNAIPLWNQGRSTFLQRIMNFVHSDRRYAISSLLWRYDLLPCT